VTGIDLSLVIPACNEEARLAAVTRWLDARPLSAEVILSDDGSTDGTARVIEEAARTDPRIRLVHHAVNRGKGAALRAGVQIATGRAVVFFDADLSYPLDTIDSALEGLRTHHVVIGARDLAPDAGHRGYPPLRRLATTAFQALVDRALDLGIRDTQCGFKAFQGSVAGPLFQSLTVDRFAFDVELLFLVRQWHLRLQRLPVEMTHDSGSSVRIVRDSAHMIADILRIRANARRGRYPARPSDLT
jgi:dolichyl-phosphate beta-glucosyltransferase